MCILFLAINSHPTYSLIIASNRDEFLDRPTEGMSLWSSSADSNDDSSGCCSDDDCNNCKTVAMKRRVSLAGRDLVAGGTWLGLDVSNKVVIQGKTAVVEAEAAAANALHHSKDNSLRWIALTNYLGDHETTMNDKTSRGSLLNEYLQMMDESVSVVSNNTNTGDTAESFVKNVHHRGDEYNGFSILVADAKGVYYYTNRGEEQRHQSQSVSEPLPTPGIYGLSNDVLDSNWPKVKRGKEMLSNICNNHHNTGTLLELHESLMEMLHDEWKPTMSSDQFPDPERCSIFVPNHILDGREYGTRSSTTILVEKDGGQRVSVLERTWGTGEDRWFYLLPKED
jgi:uncharacterized protein with NRDE domain